MSSHENSSVEQPKQPTLCDKCKSFFSNAACNGLCSKCHREQEAAQAKAQAGGAAVEALVRGSTPAPASSSAPSPLPQASTAADTAAAAAAPADEEPAPEKQKPSRCHQCRKKVGLCGFQCKCGQLFCGQHRYAEAHDCAFDHKAAGRVKLAGANPLVQSLKVQKL